MVWALSRPPALPWGQDGQEAQVGERESKVTHP